MSDNDKVAEQQVEIKALKAAIAQHITTIICNMVVIIVFLFFFYVTWSAWVDVEKIRSECEKARISNETIIEQLKRLDTRLDIVISVQGIKPPSSNSKM